MRCAFMVRRMAGCGAVLAAGVLSCTAGVWRVDFNGAGGDTLSVSNFTGWTVSNTSRTQTVANVDGGTSNTTVRLLGTGGTWTGFERSMNAGSMTNLYRDGMQSTLSGGITVSLAGLMAGHAYEIRMWYFDDEYSLTNTQTYTDVTEGRAVVLGVLTNTTHANLATGNAELPQSLYDDRYSLGAVIQAGADGTVEVGVRAAAGNTKINALEWIDRGGGEPPAGFTNGVLLAWSSFPGAHYRVEVATNLAVGGFRTLLSNVPADPPCNQQFVGVPTQPVAFYRIIEE